MLVGGLEAMRRGLARHEVEVGAHKAALTADLQGFGKPRWCRAFTEGVQRIYMI
jgi:hypothetical protein